MNKTKVYIKSEEIKYDTPAQLAARGHPCHGFEKEVIVKLPEDHERAKKTAEDAAKEEGLEVEICARITRFKKLACILDVATIKR